MVPSPTRPGPLTSQVAGAVEALVEGLAPDSALRDRLEPVRAGLGEPLRVAVAGRIKAGKSTLVNALLGQRAAATDVGECTRVVSWFRFGTPEAVDVHDLHGGVTRLPLNVDGSLPASLGVEPDEVDHLDVWLSNDALRDVTIIDTPGLASANERYSELTQQLLALDSSSRTAVAQADVLLLVIALDATRDDGATLDAFAGQFGDLRTSAMNTLTVLTRIDQLAEPGVDPIEAAAATARRCAEQLRRGSDAVLPVVGLLAEATECGVVTERDVDLLRALAGLPPAELERALVSTRRFVSSDALPGGSAERARLLRALDLYGIEVAVAVLRRDDVSSGAVLDELRDRSGVARLQRRLWGDLAARADALKAVWALGALERISHDPDLPRAESAQLRDRLERVWLAPEMQRVLLFRAVESVASGELALSAPLEDDLRQAAASELAELDAVDAAEGASRWRRFANSGRASPAQREVAEVMCRAYELRWEQAVTDTQDG